MSLNVTMTDSFDINAWSEETYKSSYGFLGLGTKTKTVYDFYNAYFQNSKSLSINWLNVAYYTASVILLPPPTLDPMFVKALDLLPSPYNGSNPIHVSAFTEFFTSFGTAFTDSIVLGGSFTGYLWYDKQLLSIQTKEEIIEEAHWSFLNIINSGHGSNSTTYNVSTSFSGTLITEYAYLGGDTNFAMNQWNEWLPTVLSDLAIVQYHIQPITLLITNSTIQANVVDALSDYANGAIQQLSAYITSLQ